MPDSKRAQAEQARKALAFDRFLADAAAPLGPVRAAVANEIAIWLRDYSCTWGDSEVRRFADRAADKIAAGWWEAPK